jgi:hypothetical protein
MIIKFAMMTRKTLKQFVLYLIEIYFHIQTCQKMHKSKFNSYEIHFAKKMFNNTNLLTGLTVVFIRWQSKAGKSKIVPLNKYDSSLINLTLNKLYLAYPARRPTLLSTQVLPDCQWVYQILYMRVIYRSNCPL